VSQASRPVQKGSSGFGGSHGLGREAAGSALQQQLCCIWKAEWEGRQEETQVI
jgi:hypothetical protein